MRTSSQVEGIAPPPTAERAVTVGDADALEAGGATSTGGPPAREGPQEINKPKTITRIPATYHAQSSPLVA